MGSTRRGVLIGVGLAASGFWAYGNRDDLPDNIPELPDVNVSDGDGADDGPPTTKFGFGSGAFKSGEWTPTGDMVVSIGADHDFKEVGLWHAVDSRAEGDGALWATTAFGTDVDVPKYDGEFTVPVLSAIDSSDVQFPSRKFKLIGFRPWGETLEAARFTVPDQYYSPNLPE